MPAPAVVASRNDAGKGAHLIGTGKEIDAVANLRQAKAWCILERNCGVDAGRVGARDILVQPAEVVDAGRGFDRRPVPLQANPLDARRGHPVLIAPDGKAIRVQDRGARGCGRLDDGNAQQAQQQSGAEDGGTVDSTDGPSSHATVVAQRWMKCSS